VTRRQDPRQGSALAAALLLGVPALDLLLGGNPEPLHAVFVLSGIAIGMLWLKEVT
jgi:hypothetical protein